MSKRTGRGFPLAKGFQVLVENDVSRFIRREFPHIADDLVQYYVPWTGKYCVGVWTNKTAGWVREVFSYEFPQEVNRADIGFLQYALSPQRIKDNMAAKQRALKAQRAELRRMADKVERERDRKTYLKKKAGMHYEDHPRWDTQPVY